MLDKLRKTDQTLISELRLEFAMGDTMGWRASDTWTRWI